MWVQTDELQYVKKIDQNKYNIIECVYFQDGSYTYGVNHIDLEEYTDDDLNEEVQGYYESLKEVVNEYGDDWRQVVSEIIAENECNLDYGFKNIHELARDLKNRFGIEVEEYLLED